MSEAGKEKGADTPEEELPETEVIEPDDAGAPAAADEDTFDPEMDINKANRDQVGDKLANRGYDGILTFSLVDVDEELDYVSGAYSPGYYPSAYGYYSNYWGYYGHYAPMAYSPGYYTNNTVYHMEANLYDVETGDLVWAARSETIEPINASSFAENFAETVANELKDEKIISNSKNTAMK